MNIIDFEKTCRSAHAKPICKMDVKNGIVLIADGATINDPDNAMYRTVWAFGRDVDNLEIGRPLLFNHDYEHNGIIRKTTQEVRVKAALHDAVAFAEKYDG